MDCKKEGLKIQIKLLVSFPFNSFTFVTFSYNHFRESICSIFQPIDFFLLFHCQRKYISSI